jgi:hypothetical protein
VDFSVAGRKYYVTGGRTQLEGEAYAFGRPRPGAENIRDTLTTVGMRGAYDTVADTVTIVLTQAAIDDANAQLALDVPATPPIPPLANGFVFPDVKVVSYLQRSAVVVSSLPAGDTAGSGCTYTLGSGSGPATIGGGTPPPSGSPDSTLSAPGSSYSWEGGPFTDFNQFGIFSPCAAPDYQGCDVKRVDLRSTSGPFTVHIRSDAGFPVVTDFDLTVYGPDGAAVGSSAAIGADETVVVNNPVPGVYTIVVSVASAVEDTYQGTATAG